MHIMKYLPTIVAMCIGFPIGFLVASHDIERKKQHDAIKPVQQQLQQPSRETRNDGAEFHH